MHVFRPRSSSPAVRICCGVVVGPANHGTAVELLPGFPALQKLVATCQLEQKHLLDLTAALFLPPAAQANVYSRFVFFQYGDSNLRMTLRGLDECFFVVEPQRCISII